MPVNDGRAGTSRQRYQRFVHDYKKGLLDDQLDAAKELKPSDESQPSVDGTQSTKPSTWFGRPRRQYLREYLRWLWPHRYGVAVVFGLALTAAGLQMVEPLFMRFIIDRVLLNAELSPADRVARLHLAGSLFVA